LEHEFNSTRMAMIPGYLQCNLRIVLIENDMLWDESIQKSFEFQTCYFNSNLYRTYDSLDGSVYS